MEIELIQDGKGVDYNKYRDVIENVKESLFRRNMGKETKEWIYISNFVGILFDKNRLILSLPKSVIIKEDVDKETLLYKYASKSGNNDYIMCLKHIYICPTIMMILTKF